MKTENKKAGKDMNIDPDNRKGDRPESNLNRDIHKNSQSERFPESNMMKDQRKSADKARGKDDSNIEELASDVEGTVGSRETGSNPDDIAGVADLDNGLRRSKRR
jgi:hypothetical protein